jgi:hypothetical protein
MSFLMGQSKRTNDLGEIKDEISGTVKANEYIKKEYPNIKGYIHVPYNIEILVPNKKDIPSFVVGIIPKDSFFEYAQTLFPDINVLKAVSLFYKTPHHKGQLAYARCAVMGDQLMINNLQRDVDYDFFMNLSKFNDDFKSVLVVLSWIMVLALALYMKNISLFFI